VLIYTFQNLGFQKVEDCGEEIFAQGVGVKWKKWARGEGEGKKKFACPQGLFVCTRTPDGWGL